MAIRVEQAQAMVAAAERAGVVLQVGHSHSYDLPIARMREIVASGALGRVRMIHTWNFTDWMARPRRAAELDVGQGGGVTYRQGAHQVDILRLIGGGLVKSVRATTFDWDDSRRSIGAHTIFLNFADGAAATAVYNGYGHFSGTELIGGVGEWGEVTKPRAAPQPSAALTPEQELAAKRKRARNAIPIERAASAAFRTDHGELRARRHPPVARRAPGLFGARPRGDRAAGGQKPARPGDRGIRRRHRRQARDAHRALGPGQSRGLHRGDRILAHRKRDRVEASDRRGEIGKRSMQPIKVKLSSDGAHAAMSVAGATADLAAHDIDRLIRDLAAVRAKMTPVHPAEPPDDPAKVHHSDNLLWTVKAAPEKSAIQFATQHPGLGWMAMWLSRAQVEDLQTSFEFELVKIPEGR